MRLMSASLPMTPPVGGTTQKLVTLQMQRAVLPQSTPTGTTLCPGQCHASIALCLTACFIPQPEADLLNACHCVLHPYLVCEHGLAHTVLAG